MRLIPALRGLALSLMMLGLAVNTGAAILHAGALATTVAHHDQDGHGHDGDGDPISFAQLDIEHQHAALDGGVIDAVLDFLAGIVDSLRDQYCSDCGHTGSKCQCDCWSGNPRDGECGA